MNKLHIHTDNGQKYLHASNFPYIFHISNFSEAYPEVNSHPISIFFISIKTEFYVVLLYNFKIIFYDKHFQNIQAKHATELISFEIQCFDSTFVDKLFKSVFKSLRFEKHDFCPSRR
jgi:hypothetical protein